MPVSEVYNCDCLEYMRKMPDKFFDLAVVDPPYGNPAKVWKRIERFGQRFDRYRKQEPTGIHTRGGGMGDEVSDPKRDYP